MIIHVEICDYCHQPSRGTKLESFKLGERPPVDICRRCMLQPLKRDLPPSPKGLLVLEMVKNALGI